jgi:hypothetical protein
LSIELVDAIGELATLGFGIVCPATRVALSGLCGGQAVLDIDELVIPNLKFGSERIDFAQGIVPRLFPLGLQLLFQLGHLIAEGPHSRSGIILHRSRSTLGQAEPCLRFRELASQLGNVGRLTGASFLNAFDLEGSQPLGLSPAILHPLLGRPKLLGRGGQETFLFGKDAFVPADQVHQVILPLVD